MSYIYIWTHGTEYAVHNTAFTLATKLDDIIRTAVTLLLYEDQDSVI